MTDKYWVGGSGTSLNTARWCTDYIGTITASCSGPGTATLDVSMVVGSLATPQLTVGMTIWYTNGTTVTSLGTLASFGGANGTGTGGVGTYTVSAGVNTGGSVAMTAGTPGAAFPQTTDDMYFSQPGTYTVTITSLQAKKWYVTAGTVTFAGTPTLFYIYGDITFTNVVPILSFSATSQQFQVRGPGGVFMALNGATFTNAVVNVQPSPITSSMQLYLSGNLNAYGLRIYANSGVYFQGYTHTVGAGGLRLETSTAYLDMATSTLNYTSSPTTYIFGSITGTAGVATLQFSGSTTANITGTSPVNCSTITIKKAGPGALAFNNFDGSFYDLTSNQVGAQTFTFTGGNTYTFTQFTLSGTAAYAKYILQSNSPGTQFTLSKASGTVNASYLNISDSNAAGGAAWYATNSTNSGNNSGWVINGISTSPSGAFIAFF